MNLTFREAVLALTALNVYKGLPQCLDDAREIEALREKIKNAYVSST